jgi:hypothetical protein
VRYKRYRSSRFFRLSLLLVIPTAAIAEWRDLFKSVLKKTDPSTAPDFVPDDNVKGGRDGDDRRGGGDI